MSKREIPEINAGSMADIAFLLLIFFLVTTTMDIDVGIPRKLPPKTTDLPPINIKRRNVLILNIGKDGNILVNEKKFMKLNEISKETKLFLDNGAGFDKDGTPCKYCHGKKIDEYSVHPKKAVISLQSSRLTKHGDYIALTNEIVRAYNELRNRESLKLYEEPFAKILERAKKNPKNEILKEKIRTIKERFPMLFSEAEPVKVP